MTRKMTIFVFFKKSQKSQFLIFSKKSKKEEFAKTRKNVISWGRIHGIMLDNATRSDMEMHGYAPLGRRNPMHVTICH